MSTSALLRDGRDDAANLPPGGGAVEGHASPSFARSPLTIAVTLIRLLLIFNALLPADLSEWLYSANLRSVLIDPVFTMHHVQEAGAVRHLSSRTKLPRGHGDFVRAYRGHETGNSRVHLPPLVLAAAEALRRQIPSEWQNVALALLVLLVDVCIAQRLEQLAARALRREEAREVEWHRKMDPKIRPALAHIFPLAAATIQSSLLRWQDLPFFVAHLYFSNPITVLAGSVAAMRGCFQNGGVLLLVTALAEASSEGGSVVLAAFALAVATYWDLHSAVFVFPCALWVGGEKAKTVGVLWGVFFIALQGLASLLLGDENFLSVFTATHLHQYRLKGLAPSLTTLWYFGMESFIRFRLYFECLLGGLPYFLVVPVVLRLYLYPSVLVAIFWFLGVLFRPPGTLFDLNIGFCFLLMNPRSLARISQIPSLVALCALPIPVILYMVGYWMWLEPNNGEANYLYFQCLAYNIFLAILFLNVCSASLRRDKALRMTQKDLSG